MKLINLIVLLASANALQLPNAKNSTDNSAPESYISGGGKHRQVPNLKALENLKKYVSIDTSHPLASTGNEDADYSKAKEFLIGYAKELSLDYSIFECKPGKPTITLKLAGTDSSLPSVFFNSHIDVVAAFPETWKYPPFVPTEDVDADGDPILYGRGTQDTKAIGIVYLEAIRALKNKDSNYKPKRNIFINFSPDEEIGSGHGLECFVESDNFKNLNVGFAIDEGASSGDDNIYDAVYSERARWVFKATANGDTGHASMFIKNLATDKIEKFHKHIRQFRNEQEAKANPKNTWDGSVTSINLDLIQGGIAINVVPPQVNYTYDMRVSPLQNVTLLEEQLKSWANESDVKLDFIDRGVTYTTPNLTENPFFKKLHTIAKEKFQVEIRPLLLPATSDAKHLRKLGIPAIGFVPYRAMPFLEHLNNEYIKLDSFYEAIQFYILALPQLGMA